MCGGCQNGPLSRQLRPNLRPVIDEQHNGKEIWLPNDGPKVSERGSEQRNMGGLTGARAGRRTFTLQEIQAAPDTPWVFTFCYRRQKLVRTHRSSLPTRGCHISGFDIHLGDVGVHNQCLDYHHLTTVIGNRAGRRDCVLRLIKGTCHWQNLTYLADVLV